MKRLLLTLSFDGTNYHGWQVQSNADTIQNRIQNALEQVLGVRPDITGCSRTDSGVHANRFCCHFDTDSNISCEKFPPALNVHLPRDIAVIKCEPVASDFHARYSCKGKNYIYKLNPDTQRNPFLYKYALEYPRNIDTDLLNTAAKDFIGTYNYSAFCASGSSVENKVRTVTDAEVYTDNGLVCFSVSADGFLYNMVRIMVGTLLEINEKKIGHDSIKNIIQSENRANAGRTAPAHGLYLNRIFY